MANGNGRVNTPKGLWAKLSVDYQFDPKVMRAGVVAEALFVRGMAFAKKQNSAVIERVSLMVLGIGMDDPVKAAEALVEVGLWEPTDEGWLVCSFAEWQTEPKKSDGGVFGNHQRWCVNEKKPIAGCPFCASSDTDSVTDSHTDSDDQSLEKRRAEKSVKQDSVHHASVTDSEFDKWWSLYPRKVAKGAAKKAWKATAKQRPAMEQMLEALERAKRLWAQGDPRFVPHPATYLNQHRWDDEPGDATGGVVARDEVLDRAFGRVAPLRHTGADRGAAVEALEGFPAPVVERVLAWWDSRGIQPV